MKLRFGKWAGLFGLGLFLLSPIGAATTIETINPEPIHIDDCKSGYGWYYDEPSSPSVIVLCDPLCKEIFRDDSERIGLVEVYYVLCEYEK